MAPGGRKSAAESPVRDLYRMVGAAGEEVGVAVVSCTEYYVRDSVTATQAHFRVEGDGIAPGHWPEGRPMSDGASWPVTSFSFTASIGDGSDVSRPIPTSLEWRVLSIETHPSHDPMPGGIVPTAWDPIVSDTPPETASWARGYLELPAITGDVRMTGWTIEWRPSGYLNADPSFGGICGEAGYVFAESP